jgi:septal ring factor EnvC (AmiA/AmiB activator)
MARMLPYPIFIIKTHRMLKHFFLLLVLLAGCFIGSAQQTKEELQKKQQELQQEIAALNASLKEIGKNKKESLSKLAVVQRKVRVREELIENINRDVKLIDNNIYLSQLEINKLNRELDTLKLQYAKSVVYAYKNRSNYDYLNFLFSSTNFNDALKRVSYLKSYRDYRETQAANISKTQGTVQSKISALGSTKTQKTVVLQEQGKQLKVLEDDRKEKDLVVKNLKNREKDIAAQVRNKERQRQKLASSLAAVIRREIEDAKRKEKERLAKLAEDEKKRQQAAAAAAAQNKPKTQTTPSTNGTNTSTVPPTTTPTPTATATKPASKPAAGGQTGVVTTNTKEQRTYSAFESTDEGKSQSINFENGRGRLPWPIDAGIVTGSFGTHKIPGTIITEVNDGIVINTQTGTLVKAIADGVVTSVFDLGGEQAVVLRHGKYFTTYSHISGVTVFKGQAVKPGTVLGRALANEDGEGQVTFMVSNDRNQFLDPEKWLKRR